jgi:hypothetical protein
MEGLGEYKKLIDKTIDEAQAARLADGVYMIVFWNSQWSRYPERQISPYEVFSNNSLKDIEEWISKSHVLIKASYSVAEADRDRVWADCEYNKVRNRFNLDFADESRENIQKWIERVQYYLTSNFSVGDTLVASTMIRNKSNNDEYRQLDLFLAVIEKINSCDEENKKCWNENYVEWIREMQEVVQAIKQNRRRDSNTLVQIETKNICGDYEESRTKLNSAFARESCEFIQKWIVDVYDLLLNNYAVGDAIVESIKNRKRQRYEEIKAKFIKDNSGFSEESYGHAVWVAYGNVIQ